MLKANAAFKTEHKSDDNAYSHLYDMSISFVTLSGSFQCGQEKKKSVFHLVRQIKVTIYDPIVRSLIWQDF